MMKKKYLEPMLQVYAAEGVEQLMKVSGVGTSDPNPGGDPLSSTNPAKAASILDEEEREEEEFCAFDESSSYMQ